MLNLRAYCLHDSTAITEAGAVARREEAGTDNTGYLKLWNLPECAGADHGWESGAGGITGRAFDTHDPARS